MRQLVLIIIAICFINMHVCKQSDLFVENESWIDQQDLKTAITLSFPFSRCCNIFYSGNTSGIPVILKQFISVYPSTYYIRTLAYECQGLFILVSTPTLLIKRLKQLTSDMSTREYLIVIDDYLDESSELFNASLFRNSESNIITKSGAWSLSENFLLPRKFKKVINYQEMQHRSGIVDLNGRRLDVATFFIPPFSYLRTTVNKTVKGIDGEFFINFDDEYDGVEVQMFRIICEKLNFGWRIRKPNHYYRYGRANGSTWNGGMIGQLWRKEIQVAFGGIWLQKDTNRFVNLTIPWRELFIRFLVPRPKPQDYFWALTKPLPPEVWFLFILMVLTQSINVYLKAKVNTSVPARFRSYIMTLTELASRLVGTWLPKQTKGLRIQLILWNFAGILFVTIYSCSLAASLTFPVFEPRIDTVKDFIEHNLTWGREAPAPNFEDYFDLNDPYEKQLPGRFRTESGAKERHERIATGKYAIVGRIVHTKFYPEQWIIPEDLDNYRLMKQTITSYYTSFAVQEFLLNSFNKVILWLIETGIVKHHLDDVIHRRTNVHLSEVLVEHDEDNGAPRVLKLIPLGAGFLFLFFGCLSATIVFYYELKSVPFDGSLWQLIKTIENRKRNK